MMARAADLQLPISLALESGQPLYEQITQQLRALILAGSLEAGTVLPSVRSLAAQLSCSVITTRRAYADLEAEGLIFTRQGLGTLVADVPQEDRASQLLIPVRDALLQGIAAARAAGLTDTELKQLLTDLMEES